MIWTLIVFSSPSVSVDNVSRSAPDRIQHQAWRWLTGRKHSKRLDVVNLRIATAIWFPCFFGAPSKHEWNIWLARAFDALVLLQNERLHNPSSR